MSLKTFHVFFILVSILLGFGFGFWCLQQWHFHNASSLLAAEAVVSFFMSFALMFYLRVVLKKLKDVSYL